ncbi:unnamed protein product, partial [Ixodes pacificus]
SQRPSAVAPRRDTNSLQRASLQQQVDSGHARAGSLPRLPGSAGCAWWAGPSHLARQQRARHMATAAVHARPLLRAALDAPRGPARWLAERRPRCRGLALESRGPAV